MATVTSQNPPEASLEYHWRLGSHMKGSAQDAGAAVAAIRDADGRVTPEQVRAEARTNPTSVFWQNMTADPQEALDKVQLIEARGILNSLEIVVVRGDDTSRERAYLPVEVVERGTLTPITRSYRVSQFVARTPVDAKSSLKLLLIQLRGVESSIEDLIKGVATEHDLGVAAAIYEHLTEIRERISRIESVAQDL